jgi:hypothetical protein
MLKLFSTPRVTFLIVFAVLGTVTVIHDPDFYFHLVAGQYILAHELLPHVDVFSFTMEGAPWHMHEWLFEVAVAALYGLGGEGAIVWTVSALGVWAWYRLFRAGIGGRKGGLVALLPALLLMAYYLVFVTPRPQVITFVAFAITLAALLDLKYRGRCQGLWLLPPLMLVWVNSHGAYLLGIAMPGLFALTEGWLWWRAGRPTGKGRQLKILLPVLAATLLATLVNPYFIDNWWFPFELMNREAMGVISEWRPPDWREPFIQGYLVCLLLFIGLYLDRKPLPDITEWLLPGAMIAASLTAVRHIPLAALTMLPFAIVALGRPSRLGAVFGSWRTARPGGELGARENLFNAVLLGAVLVLLATFSPALERAQQQLKRTILPVDAVDYIEQNGLQGRLFNQYRYGGYLLHRLYPGQRVYIDIRADMYGDAMMRDYTAMISGAGEWGSLFDRYRFDAVLCEADAPLVGLLLERGDFRLAYRDEHNVVLVKVQS